MSECFWHHNKHLLTESYAYTGKYFPEVFVQANDEGARLIRNLLCGFWLVFFPILTGFSSSDVAVYLTL